MAPLAFVIPWFGPELTGGAERHCWEVVTRLKQRGHAIEVLTTCSRDFGADWHIDFFTPGLSHYGELPVRRFRVDPRDGPAFDTVNRRLLQIARNQLIPDTDVFESEAEDTFWKNNIRSTELEEYIRAHVHAYKYFVFIPYLYGTTVFGQRACPGKAILHPCLHNEAYAYLREVTQCFLDSHAVLCISEGEKHLVERLYGPGIAAKTHVVGAGVEAPEAACPGVTDDSRRAPYLLYLGRRDATKNIELLIAAWRRFKAARPSVSLQLVLAGPGTKTFSDERAGIFDRGRVSESEKASLLAGCLALVQPSLNESYSRVLMEAWRQEKPAVVHGECLATSLAVESAEGGWTARSEDEWVEVLETIAKAPRQDLVRMGRAGAQYAAKFADWDHVIGAYETILLQSSRPRIAVDMRLRPVHQMLPTLREGDAISQQALWIQTELRARGLQSDIYVETCSPQLTPQVKLIDRDTPKSSDALIFHFSIGSRTTQLAVSHEGPKTLVYHNVTPDRFYEPYDAEFASLLRTGRDSLAGLADTFPFAYADSHYNAAELVAVGFKRVHVLPIAVDPARWALAPNRQLGGLLSDGLTNILFVGRVAPNKAQEDLVEAFHQYLCMDAKARLILAGYYGAQDPYKAAILRKIESLGLRGRVILLGEVDDATLYTLYRKASLFWSLSEHEGFCVPVVEAMWFDVPVLALAATAVPETLQDAGILLDNKTNLRNAAALASLLVHDADLRHTVLMAQRRRRSAFVPDCVRDALNSLCVELVAEPCA